MHRCEELVNSYLADSDPDAVLAVGSDMRKIQCCFSLLKVSTHCLFCVVEDIYILITATIQGNKEIRKILSALQTFHFVSYYTVCDLQQILTKNFFECCPGCWLYFTSSILHCICQDNNVGRRTAGTSPLLGDC